MTEQFLQKDDNKGANEEMSSQIRNNSNSVFYCSVMQENVCILILAIHHPSNQCAMHS